MAGIIFDDAAVQSAIVQGGRRVGLQPERARSWGWFELCERSAPLDRWSFVEPCDDGHAELLRTMMLSGAIRLRAAEARDGYCVIAETAPS